MPIYVYNTELASYRIHFQQFLIIFIFLSFQFTFRWLANLTNAGKHLCRKEKKRTSEHHHIRTVRGALCIWCHFARVNSFSTKLMLLKIPPSATPISHFQRQNLQTKSSTYSLTSRKQCRARVWAYVEWNRLQNFDVVSVSSSSSMKNCISIAS